METQHVCVQDEPYVENMFVLEACEQQHLNSVSHEHHRAKALKRFKLWGSNSRRLRRDHDSADMPLKREGETRSALIHMCVCVLYCSSCQMYRPVTAVNHTNVNGVRGHSYTHDPPCYNDLQVCLLCFNT